MNDDLQSQLAEFLKFLLTQTQDATLWAKTQIPPLVEEKIRFGRVWHSILFVLSVLVMWRLWIIVKWCSHKIDEADEWIFAIIGSIGGLVALVIVGFDNLHDAVLAWLAPRLYIIEWLVGLAKSSQ